MPLDDPVWRRLYGPYGVEDVASQLWALTLVWDDEIAGDLFWERLHHQESLYPVTYAALPWLWSAMPREGRMDRLTFLSWVLHCAAPLPAALGEASDGRYRGLATDPAAHHHRWLAPAIRLQAEDRFLLEGLEAWFAGSADAIAAACLAAVPPDEVEEAVWMLAGPLTHAGDRAVWEALDGWFSGMPPAEEAPTAPSASSLRRWADRVDGANPGIARVLRQLADEASGEAGHPPGPGDPRLPGLE